MERWLKKGGKTETRKDTSLGNMHPKIERSLRMAFQDVAIWGTKTRGERGHLLVKETTSTGPQRSKA